MNYERRDFIKKIGLGFGAAIIYNNLSCSLKLFTKNDKLSGFAMILVDYEKCAGCRTCEAVCSSYNHKLLLNNELLLGLGNPFYSNINVKSYNPDVDIPSVCALCPDAPCIEACPVSVNNNGQKALYRSTNGTIKNDTDRCLGCGECANACEEFRVGIIVPNNETNMPEKMCTLCEGDPQCVKHCPYDALFFEKGILDNKFYGLSPDEIAKILTERWYLKN
ncbi:FeS-binding protein [Candidatus Magnetomorum sp. HK-1]|nr:FeS-binding protein [Candidatus Magnetomorum sp. HK-1]